MRVIVLGLLLGSTTLVISCGPNSSSSTGSGSATTTTTSGNATATATNGAGGTGSSASTTGSGGSGGSGGAGGGAAGAGGGCQETGGLPAPDPGQTNIVATFSNPAAGYNSSTAPFNAVPINGTAINGNLNAYTQQVIVIDDTFRQINVVLDAMPAPCTTYITPSTPAVKAPFFRYLEGGPQAPSGSKQYWCGGSLVVDTVSGKSYTFHFDLACKPNPAGTTAKGTVNIAGKGAWTYK